MIQTPIRLGENRKAVLDKANLEAMIAQGKAAPGAIRTLRCRTVAQGRLSQLNYIRNLPPQPVMEGAASDRLGEAVAQNASEALLAALGSCLATGIHANAIARGISIHSLEVNLAADINPNAVWGTADLNPKPIGFEVIQVLVHLDADAPRKILDALIKHVVLWSPVANTLHNPVQLDVALAPDVVTSGDVS